MEARPICCFMVAHGICPGAKTLTFSAFPRTISQGVSGLAETECRSA